MTETEKPYNVARGELKARIETLAPASDAPTPPAEQAVQVGSTSAPKVKYTVEYRQGDDGKLLYTRNAGDPNVKRSHTGPVFEVIDVNVTDETKDTIRPAQNKSGDGTDRDGNNMAPIVSWAARQYIRIYSHCVIDALQAVVNYYPRHSVIGDPIEIFEPYAILVHHWDELKEYREQYRSELLENNEDTSDCVVKDTYEHLGYILDFLEDRWGEKVRQEKERWARDVPTASYEMLWLLLKPGTDIYYDVDRSKSLEPYVVSHVYMDIYNKAVYQYTVRVWHLGGSNYRYIQPEEFKCTIRRYDGERPIQQLEMFPCRYLDGHAERQAALIKRGKRFLELRQKKCMYFDGESSTTPRREYKGYVMVDPKQYAIDWPNKEYAEDIVDRKLSGTPYCFCKRCSSMQTEAKKPAKFDGYMRIYPMKVDKLTDHQYFICDRSSLAFIFHIREWKDLLLDGFQDAKWDMGLVENLVLKPDFKNLILNLSKTFMGQKSVSKGKEENESENSEVVQSWSADFVQNKGKGLIFLLHGKPGVGKTYTAECIAEHVKRPLLPITCADIGVDPAKVENNLMRWFKLARSWDAVMLLDEADIYMEYRQIHDLNRNNLVASFLRAIEYYEGILFFTTNRVGTFDEAFLSRITLTIYYPDFEDEERETTWHNYFDKLEREASHQFYVSDSTKEYATGSEAVKQLRWNGREIRNAFQIAVNLAQAEGSKDKKGRFVVKRDHIKVTAEMSKEFKNYMVSVHKKNESQRAQLMGYRYDAFNSPNVPKQDFV